MVRNIKPELLYFHNLISIKYYLIPIKSLGSVRCFGKKNVYFAHKGYISLINNTLEIIIL